MIFLSLYIEGLVGLQGYGICVGGPRTKELELIKENERLMEEKERLLDREILRNIYADLRNEERMLENQLIKKTYSYVRAQSLDSADGLLVKSNAEKILKVIGEIKDYKSAEGRNTSISFWITL